MRGKKAGAEGWRVSVDIVTLQLRLPCSRLSGFAAIRAPPVLSLPWSPGRILTWSPRPDPLSGDFSLGQQASHTPGICTPASSPSPGHRSAQDRFSR
ncbi:hypothetical protein P7K49_022551 [Saguinus oedipus]|uniref:Uncharacterized protein n=1 Tax=Saguinus oedipus TaxID=9490 RepID=A0ABQ9UVV3_SAGOE|nr:hypothetical protein P7K49_022551 [Saguinus oedipus]